MIATLSSSTAIDLTEGIRQIVREEVAKALAEERANAPKAERPDSTNTERQMLSINQIGKIYGVGRKTVKSLIDQGRLRCIERRCQGGFQGVFIHRSEADRVLCGLTRNP
jgi:DNA-directed RNA polymerase specialized sigma24 family protein